MFLSDSVQPYFSVASITDRDVIPFKVRVEGLVVYVSGLQKRYYLSGGITNSNWVEISYIGAELNPIAAALIFG